MVAPARVEERASSYVASECPMLVIMPNDVRAEMVGMAPGSSGARVRSLMGEGCRKCLDP
jgi:hypothetical protein